MNKLNTWALVPKLRFPEFLGDGGWEENKLDDIGKIITGKTPNTKESEFWNGNILFITPTDIVEGNKYQTYTKRAITKQKETKILPIGSIVYTCIASIGKIAITTKVSSSNQQINSIIAKNNIVNEYIYYALVNLTPYIQSISATSTLPIINKTEFSKFKIKVPKKEEQQKIANCLSSLDDLITAQSQKLTTLKTHKKGLMQQLFPNQNQTTPTLRFPEFLETGNWLNILLGKLYSFKRTNSLSRNKLNYKEGLVKNIHYGDIHTKFSTLLDIKKEIIPFINTSQSLEKIKLDNYCIDGDIIFADASEDLDDVGKSIEIINLNNEGLLSGLHTLLARQNKSKLIVGFGGHLFKSYKIRLQIKKEAQGTKVLGISAKRLNNIKICFPQNKQEQQKIADCLSSLDDLITTQNQKLAVLKTHKKGLMQQLFPINEGAV